MLTTEAVQLQNEKLPPNTSNRPANGHVLTHREGPGAGDQHPVRLRGKRADLDAKTPSRPSRRGCLTGAGIPMMSPRFVA